MTQEEQNPTADTKAIPRRKLINKVRRKIKRQNERIAKTY